MNLFTIPPNQNFLESLVDGVIKRYQPNDFGYGDLVILLPTKRACKNFIEIFASRFNSCITPKTIALGDIDADEIEFAIQNQDIPSAIELLNLKPISKLKQNICLKCYYNLKKKIKTE